LDRIVAAKSVDRNQTLRIHGSVQDIDSLPVIKVNKLGKRALIPISMVDSSWLNTHAEFRSAKYLHLPDTNKAVVHGNADAENMPDRNEEPAGYFDMPNDFYTFDNDESEDLPQD
jgi:hypothetical protein